VNVGPGAGSRHRILLGLLVCVWAISWPVMKVGVAAVPPLWFGFLRYLIATSCFFPLALVRGRLVIPARQDWPLILVSGALQMAAFSALTGLALTVLPPGRAAVLAYSTPIWVAPLAAWRLDEPISRRALLGMAAGLAGVFAIAGPSLVAGRAGQMIGYVMLMGAAALWAVTIVFVRAHRFSASQLALAPWQMLVAAILLLPCAAAVEGPTTPFNMSGALALAYVGPVATAFAYWAIVETGRHFAASTMSMALLAAPSLGILISALSLGEAIDSSLIGGLVLIVTGICLATNFAGPRQPAAARRQA